VEKETRDLVRIQQCELLESFHKSQSDYGLTVGLAVVSEVSELVLPEREVSEPMFRLILLTAREIDRTGDWNLPLSYFAFWTVKLGGWLPRFDRCATCGKSFAEGAAAYYAPWETGLLCDTCRRSGMQALHPPGRSLAERFAVEKLDRIEASSVSNAAQRELRNASLDWLEQNTERKIGTRKLLETI
jgi:DNA repair protein RecO